MFIETILPQDRVGIEYSQRFRAHVRAAWKGEEKQMPTVKKCAEATINRPAGEIWARIGSFTDIAWIPGRNSCPSLMNTSRSRLGKISIEVDTASRPQQVTG